VEVSFRGDELRSVSRRGVGSGEVVSARGTVAEVRALSTKLGLARGAPRSWNTVNVYVRADAASASDQGRSGASGSQP
jgi:hypothetical protein